MLPLLVGLGAAGLGSVISGIAGAVSSNAASKRQVNAANQARGQIEDYYNKGVAYQQPYYQTGTGI